ncbi:hypothetical protein BP6252_03951 [Coleophoma cylindrospora]|uniref:Peptidase A1 domain-containing protein n=1 Tax=Coleophoma cylindrospora TaxID=1849047 RepID=A0A3D8S912_9HELO|nr:hypothetical protein BP6252_03951 [Coleophoma cylindrospora]
MALQPRSSATPAPFSFAPSQAWEGNDGLWSTFVIRIGTPEQVFHVLISTIGQETWVPVPEGCLDTDPSNCGALRGVMPFQNQASNGFQINASSTWIPVSLFELGLEDHLNYTGNGEYGFDTVGLQLPQSGGISLEHQVVAGTPSKDFYLGVFSLGPKPTNFTTFDNPQPSFMWTLRNQSIIPSLSWGYTAGAPYRLKKVLGSLTLGGYDASRFTPNSLNLTFSADDSKPLTVGLQAIQAVNTFGGVMSLLPSGILTVIDSTVPEIVSHFDFFNGASTLLNKKRRRLESGVSFKNRNLTLETDQYLQWLPVSACTIFETAFGLNYDPHTDRYLVNETTRQRLLALSPVVTFVIGNTVTGGKSITIDFPYEAFDLQADYPIYPNATNYFPLRRAANDTQYTLGRTFLQEAYVIADYERLNFSVSQCIFEENNPERITPIHPPVAKHSKSGLPRNAMIGVIVAIVVFAMILATCFFICIRIKKRKKKQTGEISTYTEMAAKHDSVTSELMADHMGAKHVSEVSEMVGQDMRHELIAVESPMELQGSPVPPYNDRHG